MKRVLKILLWLLLLVVIAVPVALYSVLMTEPGSQWALRKASDWLSGQGYTFSYSHSEGRLAERITLHDVLFSMDGTEFAAKRTTLEWRPWELSNDRLHVVLLEVVDSRLALPASPPSEDGPVSIPDIVLPVEVVADRLAIERFQFEQADARYFIDALSVSASLADEVLALNGLSFKGMDVQLTGELTLGAVAPHRLGGRAAIQVSEALLGPDVGYLAASLELGGEALKPALNVKVTDPARLTLHGKAQLDLPSPTFDVAANWDKVSWPLRGAPTVTLNDGRLTLVGSADDYRAELQALAEAESMPPAEMDVTLRGNLNGIVLQPAVIKALDGQATADGSVSWQKQLEWAVNLQLAGINPQALAAEWPGEIDGRLRVTGNLDLELGGDPLVELAIESLSGQVRGYPVSASGNVAMRGSRLRADRLAIASGANRVNLDGRWDDALDLKFVLDAPDLAGLLPDLQGGLQGSGNVSGSVDKPVVVANLTGSNVTYEGNSVNSVDLDIDWRGERGQGQLRAAGIDAQGTRIDELTTDINGTLDGHDIALHAAGDVGRLDLAARGGWQEPLWRGTLNRLELDEPNVGLWVLSKPSAIKLGAEQIDAEQLCLGRNGADVCIDGGWQAEQGLDANGRLQGFDLAKLVGVLPGNAVIDGVLQGRFSVTGALDRPDAQFELAPGDGEIRFPEAEEPFVLPYANARISGRFKDDRGTSELTLNLGAAGEARGKVNLGPATDGDRSLDGNITAAFPDLSLIAGFVPQLEQVQGRLNVQTRLGGSLAEPRVEGLVSIDDASARLPAAGIELKGIGLALRSDGGPMQVNGQLTSGEGTLRINGNVDLGGAKGPTVDLTLKGDGVLVAQLPEAVVKISPDLTLSGSGPYHLAGVVRVPQAKIELKELPPSTVAVSDDEIIVNGDEAPEIERGPGNLTAKVRVELGKDVTFAGFGLKTGLAGAIDASVDSKGTNAQGKIELIEGEYRAYGQDLKVERGRLLFAGPPSDPDVDLRASRTSIDGQYVAYLSLQGPLSEPLSKVYTEPSTSQAESLAYLLTGAGLSEANEEQGSRILSAAYSFGLARGEPLLQQLSDRLGLDEIRVDTGAGLEESSLILGKYLSPDLYLGYTQGLFDPDGAVLMRLKLSEHIEVETRSSDEQSVDLFYRIEHD